MLTRQNLPVLDDTKYDFAENVSKGAYILEEPEDTPDLIIIATGSEVHLALKSKVKVGNTKP